jgi:hypothetical protein
MMKTAPKACKIQASKIQPRKQKGRRKAGL